jgi:hypothetical protein
MATNNNNQVELEDNYEMAIENNDMAINIRE